MDVDLQGCDIIPGVLTPQRCVAMACEIELAFQADAGAIQSTRGGLVGGRNLILLWNGWREITDHPKVAALVEHCVGRSAGVVRILYFDKPPGQSWSLSMHRDKTIAVEAHQSPPHPFDKPTRKAGVPHVEATESLLCQMLTLRLHLDPMQDENGPLVVCKGSHETSGDCGEEASVVHCDVGDLFIMRPMLLHGSRASEPDAQMHRRVVHLEIGPERTLPGNYRWHCFKRLDA
ncbi:MAG: phytanoyl-CoA dioxygenase family protein [Rubripirellula sp.]